MKTINLPLKNIVKEAKDTSRGLSIFFLHGFGSNMNDLYGLSPFFGDNWTCISLQAEIPVQYDGWAWAELNPNNLGILPKPEQIERHYEKIIQSIEQSTEILQLDNNNINLLGFSQGASLSIYCGIKNPGKFKSIVALCGFLPMEQIDSEIIVDQIKDLDLFMGNGKQDLIVPIKLAKLSRNHIKSLGANLFYKEYNSEHTISNDCLNDVLRWLEERNKG
tara:strand:+ start:2965 stop:3624 length:660 start_codon:yes stop_codon:yes gene_type:complete